MQQLGTVSSWGLFTSSGRHRGFDPSANALEKVRRDNVAPAPTMHRARSLSPIRGATPARTKKLKQLVPRRHRGGGRTAKRGREAVVEEHKHEERHEAPAVLGRDGKLGGGTERPKDTTSAAHLII
jgi:hypothetical protein